MSSSSPETSSSSSSFLQFQPTCDLYDKYLDQARVPSTMDWKSFGGTTTFWGVAITMKCLEDNSRLKELCYTPAPASTLPHLLVVDAGGSRRCAILGDLLAKEACHNQWAGVIVNGCVRDAAALAHIPLGIFALGTTPRKSTRRGEGQTNIPVQIGDVLCYPGDYVFADQDGVLILDPKIVKGEKGSG